MNDSANAASWADAIARRAGTYGLGPWLPTLAQWLGDVDFANWLPANEASAPITVQSNARGIAFTLAPLSGYDAAAAKVRASFLVLDNIVFDAEQIARLGKQASLPFGLLVEGETSGSAAGKIGTSDSTEGRGFAKDRISYFLDDLRVVEITFTQSLRIHRVLVTKLWQPTLFGARSSQPKETQPQA